MKTAYYLLPAVLLFLISFTFRSGFSPEEGLVAYYSFNQCDARDDTGNGSDGKLFGDVACWCGVEDDGLLLDGVNDYIEFTGRVNRYFTTSDFTLSFYVKPEQHLIFRQSLLSKRTTCENDHSLDLLLDQGKKEIDTHFYETEHKFFPGLSPGLEEQGWIHFALVREGIRAYTYINGLLVRQSTRCSGVDISNEASLSFSNSPCISRGMSRRFRGVIDELRVYDRALSEEDVRALYLLHPVENALMDCVTFAPKKSNSPLFYPAETRYLCASF